MAAAAAAGAGGAGAGGEAKDLPKVKVVILAGGPSLGTRFRPLSLAEGCPKPLFPVAGKALLWQHFRAAAGLRNNQQAEVLEVLVLGFEDFGDNRWSRFLDEVRREFFLNVRTLHEGSDKKLGTGGGLRRFRADIEAGEPEHVFVLHGDVCCEFPLGEVLATHARHAGACTILGKQVRGQDEARRYGVLGLAPEDDTTTTTTTAAGAADAKKKKKQPREVMHYVEKPQSFVSDVINCGVYAFRRAQFYALLDARTDTPSSSSSSSSSSSTSLRSSSAGIASDFLRLEQDVLVPACGTGEVFLHQTSQFWLQIKSAGHAILASQALLQRLKERYPHELASNSSAAEGAAAGGATAAGAAASSTGVIVGNVLIDPSARVHPTARLGPDVSIGPGVVVGPGARVRNSIILDDVVLEENSATLNAIVGWGSSIGPWARIEGVPDFSRADDDDANNIDLNGGITILGTNVAVAKETMLRAVIALPHKSLSGNYAKRVLL